MFRTIVALFAMVLAVRVQAAPAADLPPDIAAIRQANKLTVGMTSFDASPFYSGSATNPVGLDADIARRVAETIGVPVAFRRDAPTFNDVVEQVRRGDADLALSKLSITPGRLVMVRFSEPYAVLHPSLLVNRLWLTRNGAGRDESEVVRSLDGPVSFIRNTLYDTNARAMFPKATFLPHDSWNEVVDDVISGRAAAAFRDEFEIRKVTMNRPEAGLATKSVILTDRNDYIAAVVGIQSVQLLQIVNFVLRDSFGVVSTKDLLARERRMTGERK